MGTSRSWVVTESGSPRVVAFYASCTSSVLSGTAPASLGKGQPDELPAILLGRMAVDSKHKGQGLGAALLKHFMLKAIEVAISVGVRIVLVHAKDEEAKAPYKRFAFTESPVDSLTLMMLLPMNRA